MPGHANKLCKNAAMLQLRQRWLVWAVLWCAITALGCVALARLQLTQLREAFETDARIVHRLLSQRVVQHDAVMATLALLQAAHDPAGSSAQPEQRLASVYPQFLGVQRRDHGALWPQDNLRAAEEQSRQSHRAALADVDFSRGRYQLVLSAEPASVSPPAKPGGLPYNELSVGLAASRQSAMAEAARGLVERSCYKSTTYRHRKRGER